MTLDSWKHTPDTAFLMTIADIEDMVSREVRRKIDNIVLQASISRDIADTADSALDNIFVDLLSA